MVRWVLRLLVLVAVGGGAAYYFLREDPLRAELDRRWPPVTAEQQRQAAIDAAASALKVLAAPNLASGVDIATIQRIAFDDVKSKGVTKLVLVADRQLLQMTADFDVTLTPDNLPENSEKRSLVGSLEPHIVGEVELYLTAAPSLSDAPQRALLIKLLPAVSRVRIDKLTVKGKYDVSAAADVIGFLLNRYVDNLNGALSASPVMNVTLPTTLQKSFDPSGQIKIDLKEAPGLKLSLAAHPVGSQVSLGATALLIDTDKVLALVELLPLDKPTVPTEPANASFEAVKAAFNKSLQDGLAIVDPLPGVWAALSKALIARTLDSAFAQAQPCLDGSGSIPKVTLPTTKIPTPDGSSINCTPTKSCDLRVDIRDCRRPPQCTHLHDTRNCQGIGKIPCEAAKAAQNQAYDRSFDLCNAGTWIDDQSCEAAKATQNGLYATQKATCEADKKTESMACETEKGAIVALHRTGNIGNVDGSVAGTGTLSLCFRDVHFSAALDGLTMTVAASGSATLDTHFKFTPLDVGGHILCPFEWTADKDITTMIPPQSIGAILSLARETDAGGLTYKGRLEAMPIKLHFQPSPLALVLQNFNFDLACPVTASLINELTLGLAPFIPEFLQDYTYELEPTTFSFAPDLPAQSIFGRNITPKVSETSLALIVSGTL